MRVLVQVDPVAAVDSLTLEAFGELAKLAPLCEVQRFLLRHVRCLAGRSDAVELEPPASLDGEYRGRCLHCGSERELPVIELGGGAPVLWWAVLLAKMTSEYFDIFIDEDLSVRSEAYQRTVAALEATVRRCALLELADEADGVH